MGNKIEKGGHAGELERQVQELEEYEADIIRSLKDEKGVHRHEAGVCLMNIRSMIKELRGELELYEESRD